MFRVVWEPEARRELAAIWHAAPASDDRLLIWAVADISFRLEREPENEGESRSGGTRVMFSRPLAVWFERVSAEEVWVYHVWRRN